MIDGDIVRERIIERNTGLEDWRVTQVYDEPIIGCELGVIIGPYVLSGWRGRAKWLLSNCVVNRLPTRSSLRP
ncbi:MAG TPA: hypothetical protein PLY87_13725 [Planctomycetaceae bacterium]|nr:hypothetical protein [Planctomycetaceae bacterium]HQZ66141.1 hypothetical protein [Planctomycetaceae bacterium]